MRPFSDGDSFGIYPKFGLMVLKEHFDQRPIDTISSSSPKMVPLTTQSGPQPVISDLEAELLEQLTFALNIYDVMTRPIIGYTADGQTQQYTPAIAVQLGCFGDNQPCRYIIEVKTRADLQANSSHYAEQFQAGTIAAANMGAAFRIMTEDQIRTPYLANARRLRRHLADDPEFKVFDLMRREIGAKSISVTETIDIMRLQGLAEPDIRNEIEQAVAWRMCLCDLGRPFNDSTMIRARLAGEIPGRIDDALLKALHEAEFP